MSDWHFGGDYDMWLYPPVDWTPDCDYELPEPIEAANIEGTLLINAKDAIEQMRRLQAENAKLRELVSGLEYCTQGLVCDCCPLYDPSGTNHRRCESLERDLGAEVDDG